jgi:hypothetical protein
MTACPRCGKGVDPTTRICPGCGVILSKIRPRPDSSGAVPQASPAQILPRPPRPPRPPLRAPLPSLPLIGTARPGSEPVADLGHTPPGAALRNVILTGAVSLIAIYSLSQLTRDKPSKTALPSAPAARKIEAPKAPPPAPIPDTALTPEDHAFLSALWERVKLPSAASVSDADIARLDEILIRGGNDSKLRDFAFGVYAHQATRALEAGSFAALDDSVAKMKRLDARHPRSYELEAYGRARQGDWTGAEAAARTYESLAGETIGVATTLALSLQSQGRGAEALAVLDRPLYAACPKPASRFEADACETALGLRRTLSPALERIPETTRTRAALDVSPSKDQIQSERFDVRFDGDTQTGVARDVLFVLDRAYTRLADIYYERPARKIPVVLHSSRDYYSATGAPFWSGGQFSSHTGAIQIPIRGLPSTLPREMEDVLVHELSHAFVDEMSGGHAGRDLQEGLAQFVSGKRIESELTLPELKSLANSRGQDVMNFYMLSLAVTQQLVQSRGQGRVNDLLKAMKEAGSEDRGFVKVFGQSALAMKADILETFWRRYS